MPTAIDPSFSCTLLAVTCIVGPLQHLASTTCCTSALAPAYDLMPNSRLCVCHVANLAISAGKVHAFIHVSLMVYSVMHLQMLATLGTP